LPPSTGAFSAGAGTAGPAPRAPASVNFRYEGPTRLQTQGPITRQRYRFEHSGAIVAVDARDAPSLAAIPQLRRVQVASG
jgi:hypothetical protein